MGNFLFSAETDEKSSPNVGDAHHGGPLPPHLTGKEIKERLSKFTLIDDLVKHLENLDEQSKLASEKGCLGPEMAGFRGHYILHGSVKSVRSSLAKLITAKLHNLKHIKVSSMVTVNASELRKEANFHALLTDCYGGTLLVEKPYRLEPSILKLFLDYVSSTNPTQTVIIFAGDMHEMVKLIESNPAISENFPYVFHIHGQPNPSLMKTAYEDLDRILAEEESKVQNAKDADKEIAASRLEVTKNNIAKMTRHFEKIVKFCSIPPAGTPIGNFILTGDAAALPFAKILSDLLFAIGLSPSHKYSVISGLELIAGISLAESAAGESSYENIRPGDLSRRPSRKSISAAQTIENKKKTPEDLKAEALKRIDAVFEDAVGGVLVITDASELSVDPAAISAISELLMKDEYTTEMVVILVDGEPEMERMMLNNKELKRRFMNVINLQSIN